MPVEDEGGLCLAAPRPATAVTGGAVDRAVLECMLDPTGRSTGPVPGPAHAARPKSLRGVRVGLVDTTRQAAVLMLSSLGRLMVDRYGAVLTVRENKHAFALPLEQPLLVEMAAGCDVVVIGVGDCGACSASAVADGIAFERLGVPSAVVCTDAFDITAHAMAELHGAPDYTYLTTPHPVAPVSDDEVAEQAREILPEVVARVSQESP